jgi:hypothetical protein
MAEIGERLIVDAPGAGFAERHVDADGFLYAQPGRLDRGPAAA